MSIDVSSPMTAPTPESLALRRKMALDLMAQGSSAAPVGHWTQAVARALQGTMGGLDVYQADKEQNTARTDAIKQLLGAVGGPAGSSSPSPAAPQKIASALAPNVIDQGGTAKPDEQGAYGADAVMLPGRGSSPYATAIAANESGGNYKALGPTVPSGDRAYGKYQVMGSNVGPWTKEVLGQEMTPQQFVASPQAQDAVFNAKFGQYAQKYGPEGAARAWFAGEGGMNDMGRKDPLGTTVAGYGQKFVQNGGASDPAALPENSQPAQGFAVPGQPSPGGQAPQGGVDPRIIAALSNQFLPPGLAQIASTRAGQQMSPPDFKQIGQTVLGQPQYGWVDPNKQTVKPIGGEGGSSATAGGISGEDPSFQKIAADVAKGAKPADVYKHVPVELRESVKALVEGNSVPANIGTRGAARTAAVLYAHAVDPTFDESLIPQRTTYARGIGNTQSMFAPGGQRVAIGTGIGHMADLAESLVDMHNKDLGPISAIPGSALITKGYNTVANSTGDMSGKVKRVEETADRTAGEMGKIYSGSSGGGVHEREATRNRFSSNLQPTAAAGALEATRDLLIEKIKSNEAARDQVFGSNSTHRIDFMDKGVRANLERINKAIETLRGRGGAAEQSAPADAAAPTNKTKSGVTWSVQ